MVYSLICWVNGKEYIGISYREKRPGRRWVEHCSRARRGVKRPLYAAIRKYGRGAFDVVHLADALTLEDARAIEQQLIAERGTLFPGGYNLTEGGEGTIGRVVSPELR